MYRKEACVEKVVEMAYQNDTILQSPGPTLRVLEPSWTELDAVIVASLFFGNLVEMKMLLRNDMACLDGRADAWVDTPRRAFAGDVAAACCQQARGPK